MAMVGPVHRTAVTRKIRQVNFLVPKALARLNALAGLQELDPRYLNILVVRLHKRCGTLRFTVWTLALHYPIGGTKRNISFVSLFSNLENLENLAVAVLTESTPMTPRSQRSYIHHPCG